ncbi:ent-kaurene oxidase protein [Rutstroemia sp. NJR-2017a BVV2]|nr:ent-kaurene oxidase protein [Rutstroemia sp. NJR-2017a BVV2]
MAIVPIQREHTENPDRFDGLRYYRKRLEPGQEHKHQFATTDNHTLHFGHGKYGCPGRFMASNTIKMILGQLLLDYDFKFPEGQSRPQSLPAFEYSFPDPTGKVMFRERRDL